MADESGGSDDLNANLDATVERIRHGALAVTQNWAKKTVVPQMKSTARWNDRNSQDSMTGKNARDSLEAEAVMDDDETTILAVARSTRQSKRPWREWNGAPIGNFLELGTRRMPRYATIKPTLDNTVANLHDALQDMLKGDL